MNPARKTRVAALGLAFFALAGQTSAQSPPATGDVCPPGYSVFESVCLSETTGDIVNQRPAKSDSSRSSSQCSPGSTSVNSSCVDLATRGMEQIASGDLY